MRYVFGVQCSKKKLTNNRFEAISLCFGNLLFFALALIWLLKNAFPLISPSNYSNSPIWLWVHSESLARKEVSSTKTFNPFQQRKISCAMLVCQLIPFFWRNGLYSLLFGTRIEWRLIFVSLFLAKNREAQQQKAAASWLMCTNPTSVRINAFFWRLLLWPPQR